MRSLRGRLRPAADVALRRSAVRGVALRIAAARGRGLALLWHRVRPAGPRDDEAVRAVATAALATQLDLLLEIGEVVPLAALEEAERSARPRFALTFDDDDAGHLEHTLPLLRERVLPATFFLSGRWQGDDGPYWWEVLEARVRDEGVAVVASSYGLPPDTTVERIAVALTGTRSAVELAAASRGAGSPPMSREQARALVEAGMEIGYHTRHHPSLPTLADDDLRDAVGEGRARLAAELETPVTTFAYPHGHVDDRVAAAVSAGGYRSAWTTSKRVAARGEDPMRLGRWDLGHRDLDTFRAAVLLGVARPTR
jgi:peptidoglycan/xylan/chitin deacetylase (PgdA/CDA1 family)